MLDDLRNSAAQSYAEEERQQFDRKRSERPRRKRKFLGMTAAQRFLLAVLILIATCVMGALCLVATQRVFIM